MAFSCHSKHTRTHARAIKRSRSVLIIASFAEGARAAAQQGAFCAPRQPPPQLPPPPLAHDGLIGRQAAAADATIHHFPRQKIPSPTHFPPRRLMPPRGMSEKSGVAERVPTAPPGHLFSSCIALTSLIPSATHTFFFFYKDFRFLAVHYPTKFARTIWNTNLVINSLWSF